MLVRCRSMERVAPLDSSTTKFRQNRPGGHLKRAKSLELDNSPSDTNVAAASRQQRGPACLWSPRGGSRRHHFRRSRTQTGRVQGSVESKLEDPRAVRPFLSPRKGEGEEAEGRRWPQGPGDGRARACRGPAAWCSVLGRARLGSPCSLAMGRRSAGSQWCLLRECDAVFLRWACGSK